MEYIVDSASTLEFESVGAFANFGKDAKQSLKLRWVKPFKCFHIELYFISYLVTGLRLVVLIAVFTHVVFGSFQSLHSSVMGGFDPVCISLGSGIFGFFGRCRNCFRNIPIIGVKWSELRSLGYRIVVSEFS
jgi:hypothetical protein